MKTFGPCGTNTELPDRTRTPMLGGMLTYIVNTNTSIHDQYELHVLIAIRTLIFTSLLLQILLTANKVTSQSLIFSTTLRDDCQYEYISASICLYYYYSPMLFKGLRLMPPTPQALGCS